MKKIIELITKELKKGFEECGYDAEFGLTTRSNRPDLCQYQCNGAMAAAKKYKKAPIAIAGEVVERVRDCGIFQEVAAVMPGFININLTTAFLVGYLTEMAGEKDLGFAPGFEPKTIVIDYGGPNVAKPLHVGHLRSAVIGESLKRLLRFAGNRVIGDAHLGDWGLPIGLIITELKKRMPQLVYFDDAYQGEYPKEPPFTISELEKIYPFASAKSKEDEAYKEEAREATLKLQNKNPGYFALWKHILEVSIEDLRKNYKDLNVEFDVWKKESDVADLIPDMIRYLKDGGYTRISEGALVVDVKEETDTKEMPPCMILKSNGASLYDTTDVATIMEREKLFHPDTIIYVVDKRQDLYFERVFRCAKKTGLIHKEADLIFIGFGTMNGRDGKPFKTRDGGVMRLEDLIAEVRLKVCEKIMSNRDIEKEEAEKLAKDIGLAALKYGDLSNQASKDFIFDSDRFTSFEGDTGPYLLYTMVRIKSILEKYKEIGGEAPKDMALCGDSKRERSGHELALMLAAVRFNEVIETAAKELAPHKLCQYSYELSNAFNSFYHENKIIAEEDKKIQEEWLAFILLVLKILEICIDLLGFEAPLRM